MHFKLISFSVVTCFIRIISYLSKIADSVLFITQIM